MVPVMERSWEVNAAVAWGRWAWGGCLGAVALAASGLDSGGEAHE